MDYQKTVPPTMSPYGGWVYTPVQIPPIMPSDPHAGWAHSHGQVPLTPPYTPYVDWSHSHPMVFRQVPLDVEENVDLCQ